MLIQQSELEDQGLYQCILENPAGRVIKTARLRIDWNESELLHQLLQTGTKKPKKMFKIVFYTQNIDRQLC